MELRMATAQLSSLPNAINDRETCVQSEYRQDQYFRLHVARVEEPESALNELRTAKKVPLSPLRSNGKHAHDVGYVQSEDLIPKTIDNHHSMNGLSKLPLAGHSLAELERETIQQTLKLNKGKRKLSAEILGISVRTLQRKLKEYDNDIL